MENPDEELGIAHFIAIWEVKDENYTVDTK